MPTDKTSAKHLGTLTVTELKALASKNRVALKGSLKADIARELASALRPSKDAAKKKAPAGKASKAPPPKAAKKAATAKASAKASAKKAPAKKATKAPARKAASVKTPAKKAAEKTPQKQPVKKTAQKKAAPKPAPIKLPTPAEIASGAMELAALTVSALKEFAQKQGIALKARSKADMMDEIKKAVAPAERAVRDVIKKAADKVSGMAAKGLEKIKSAAPVVGATPPKAPAEPSPKAQAKASNKLGPGNGGPRNEHLAPMAPKAAAEGDWASAIAVEPGRIFVSWDIKQPIGKSERLVLRLVDVTALETHGVDAEGSYIQVPLKKSTGGMFMKVMAGRLFEALIGKMDMYGEFIAFASASTVGTPAGRAPKGKSLLEEEHFSFTPSGKDPQSSY